MKKKYEGKKEEIAEDFCFSCKDGGHLRVCDFAKCLKAYHPQCVDKDDSFLEDDDRWTCGLHKCSCGKNSSFKCFCCPTSYCRSCVRSAGFAEVRKKKKGFCFNCVRLVKMIEEDRNVDSDGDEVDFDNTETTEFLFKDYWVIVKDQEKLTLVDIQAADALLKKHEKLKKESDSDEPFDEESMSGSDSDDSNASDDGKSVLKGSRGKRGRKKTFIRKSKRERVFTGWASEELTKFLASIGKSTTESLDQMGVTEIIKEYVQLKNLFDPSKKKKNHVIPDEKLRVLFRKKKLKYHKISGLVKNHLAEEQSEEFSFSSEEDEGTVSSKKQRNTNSDYKTIKREIIPCLRKVPQPPRSLYAAIVPDNIKLVYMKRSLLLELLKNPETFEEKVMGCFVRIKNDPKDFYYSVQKAFQLGRVTGGIKKTEQAYKIGETGTDIALSISNIIKDIKISMLSDDDVQEEECEDLRQLVKKGFFKRPTIAWVERKMRSVHEDITNHWIDKEIAKLQKKIEHANEKGWRLELNEYIDRRELLRTQEERTRLLKEIPEVIPDSSNTETDANGLLNLDGLNEDENGAGEGPTEESKEKCISNNSLIKINDEEQHPKQTKTSQIEIIDLDDDDDDDDDNCEIKADILKENQSAITDTVFDIDRAIWHYKDPSGDEQGPFALSLLCEWDKGGFFPDDFEVWKSGQCEGDAILLTVALASAFPDSK